MEIEEYDELRPTFLLARKGMYWGIISSDRSRRVLLPFEYDEMSWFGQYILLKKNGKYGLWEQYELTDSPNEIKEKGIVLPCIADYIYYDEDLYHDIYRINGKVGLVEPHTDAIYDYFFIDNEYELGIIGAVKDGKSGYLDKACNFCEPVQSLKRKGIYLSAW